MINFEINENGYLSAKTTFEYLNNTNDLDIFITYPEKINGTIVGDREVWIEGVKKYAQQETTVYEKLSNKSLKISDNPKGTIISFKVLFLKSGFSPIVSSEIALQIGINEAGGLLPELSTAAKLINSAFCDFVIIGDRISFYNLNGKKTNETTLEGIENLRARLVSHEKDENKHIPVFSEVEMGRALIVMEKVIGEYIEPYSVTVSSTGMLTGEDRFVLINPTAILNYAVTNALKGFVFSCTLTKLDTSIQYSQAIESSSYRNAYEILITCPSSGLILSAGNYAVSNATIDVNTYVPVLGWKEVAVGEGIKPTGTADDIQINAAIQKLSDGGKIVLGAGTYVLHDSIVFNKNNITIEGVGNSTILKWFGADVPVVDILFAKNNNCIKNLVFDLNNSSDSLLITGNDNKILNCAFKNSGSYVISMHGSRNMIKECLFEETLANGISIVEGGRNTVTQCISTTNGKDYTGGRVVDITGGYEHIVSDNMINMGYDAPIHVSSSWHVIKNNIFYDSGYAAMSIVLNANSSGCKVFGNAVGAIMDSGSYNTLGVNY